MAFTTAELAEIKAELGYTLLSFEASAYINVSQLFEAVVNSYIADAVETTSTLSSDISAASSPTPQTLTLASATGFAAGAVVFIDVDSRAERVTIQSLSGSDIVVQLQKAHSGTIPVALYGPIPKAREVLAKIRDVKSEMASTFGEGSIKKVDEVEFFGQRDTSMFGSLGSQLRFWRNELASVLGVRNVWEERPGGGRITSLSVY